MLADARTNNGLSLDDLVQALEHVMRLYEVTLAIVFQRMFTLELRDLPQPRGKIFVEAAAVVEQVVKTAPRIGNMRPCHKFHFSDFARIDIDMRDVFRV